jgi:hypothetical protein
MNKIKEEVEVEVEEIVKNFKNKRKKSMLKEVMMKMLTMICKVKMTQILNTMRMLKKIG